MNGAALVEAAGARLAAGVDDWPVYEHGVPDGPLPARYVVAWGSEGSEWATRAADTVSHQSPTLWVTAVCRHGDARFAASEVAGVMARVRQTLRGFRPAGRPLVHEASSPPRRDESLPETVIYAVETFTHPSPIQEF